MFNQGPVLACYLLVGVAACGLWAVGQHQQAQHYAAVAQAEELRLDMLEPAAGPKAPDPVVTTLEAPLPPPAEAEVAQDAAAAATHAASEASAEAAGEEGGHGPKKSFTGKVLSADSGTPSITLGSLKVSTRKDLKADAERAFTPAELRTPETLALLKRRFHFTPYAHNVARGTPKAPMTIVEFSDPSCVACADDLKRADEIYQQYADRVNYIQVFLPVERNTNNLAAFYGKVAQRGGRFWEYRQALHDLKDATPDSYFNALIQAGVPAADARHWITGEARRFYRELDADAQLARALGLDKPPHFFVNGIHVGDGGISRGQLGAVLQYESNYTYYQLDGLAHD